MKRIIIVLLLVVPSLVAFIGPRESDEVDPVMYGPWVGDALFLDQGRLSAEKKDNAAMVVHRPHDSTIDGEIHLKTTPLYDSTMREAQLKLWREMGTDPFFSGS